MMKVAAATKDEVQRIRKLKKYQILDTLPEDIFDDFTFIASQICNTPISLISLVDKNRQWFKSKLGIDVQETERSVAFCAHAIHENKVLYIPDAEKDERFFDNPLVTSGPKVRFYAGAPITTPEGHNIGTLCVIDQQPRNLTEEQIEILVRLSNQIAENLEFRLNKIELEKRNNDLKDFAYRVSHDLKSPLTTARSLTYCALEDIETNDLAEASVNLKKINKQMESLELLIADIFSLVQADTLEGQIQIIDFKKLLDEIKERLSWIDTKSKCEIVEQISITSEISLEKARIMQIIQNLASNSIKYMNLKKQNSFVKIKILEKNEQLIIEISDNGLGIPPENHLEIFSAFKRFHPNVATGSGLGMSIVKKHVDYMNGEISFESSTNGTVFKISLPI